MPIFCSVSENTNPNLVYLNPVSDVLKKGSFGCMQRSCTVPEGYDELWFEVTSKSLHTDPPHGGFFASFLYNGYTEQSLAATPSWNCRGLNSMLVLKIQFAVSKMNQRPVKFPRTLLSPLSSQSELFFSICILNWLPAHILIYGLGHHGVKLKSTFS